ncbi:MAG TPA: NifU family protein [Verrucomicrobiae bacterium]|nr:NifU family protein [Verrucomicrobiae bacterium]
MNAILALTSIPSKLDGPAGDAAHFPQVETKSRGRRIQELTGKISSLQDTQARELLRECLESVLELHEDGLRRIMQLLKNAGAAGRELSDGLLRDGVIRGLLLIHGLHPVPLEKRLLEALDRVRPFMQSQGGNVELITFENNHARLRVRSECQDFPSSSLTMELAVREAVEEACPDLLRFEVEAVLMQPPIAGVAPTEPLHWIVLEDLGELDEGEMRSIELEDAPVLVVKTGGNLYAYRNLCPACGTRLDEGTLKLNILKCRRGHEFDARRAGMCPHRREIHLELFPLLTANDAVKISVEPFSK